MNNIDRLLKIRADAFQIAFGTSGSCSIVEDGNKIKVVSTLNLSEMRNPNLLAPKVWHYTTTEENRSVETAIANHISTFVPDMIFDIRS